MVQENGNEKLLEVKDLVVSFFTYAGEVKAVRGISYTVRKGEVMGIVGESGSGKSVSSFGLLGMIPEPGKVLGGEILFDGQNVIGMSERELLKIRGKDISMIFQDPMTSLNPVFTVGDQIDEVLRKHTNLSKEERRNRIIELFSLVGINQPEKRISQFPYEFSGGMRQRVMIAMALACEPDILIADEPTTALDVTIQAQILELMQDLQKKLGMAVILVTHDLGVIAELCDNIIVMYGGRICERGTANEIFYSPRHEYTKGLLKSIPNVKNMKEKLVPISGTPINILNLPKGCPFCARCENCMKICLEQPPMEIDINENHKASCWMNVKLAFEGGAV